MLLTPRSGRGALQALSCKVDIARAPRREKYPLKFLTPHLQSKKAVGSSVQKTITEKFANKHERVARMPKGKGLHFFFFKQQIKTSNKNVTSD